MAPKTRMRIATFSGLTGFVVLVASVPPAFAQQPATGPTAAPVTGPADPDSTTTAVPAPAASTGPTGGDELVGDDFDDFSLLDLAALLDTEVDVGSGFKQKISDIPAIVEIMNRDRIMALGVRDLNELIQRLIGVYWDHNAMAPIGANYAEIRGGGISDRILLIIDDHPQLGEFDEVYNGYGIPIEAIERVEFLRGPAAVLYGTSSMAGVLRVVTRRGEQNGGGAFIGAGVGNKTRGVVNQNVPPVDHTEELAGWATIGNADRDAWSVRTDIQARRTPDKGMYFPDDGFGTRGTFAQHVEYFSHLSTVRKGGLYLRAQNHIMSAPIQGLASAFALDTSTSTLQLHGGEVGYTWAVADNWTLKFREAIDWRFRDFDFGRFPPFDTFGRGLEGNRTKVEFDGYVNDLAATSLFQNDQWKFLAGIQFRSQGSSNVQFRFTDNGDDHLLFPAVLTGGIHARIHDANLLVQLGYAPVEALELLLGYRLSQYKTLVKGIGFNKPGIDNTPDPRTSQMMRSAIIWRVINQFTVKALYGRSFRLPTAAEMYVEVLSAFDPNPGLKPEFMDTWELSLEARPRDDLFLRLNGFWNENRDSIEFSANPDPTRTAQLFLNNEHGFSNRGVEFNMDWYAGDWLNLFGGGVFMEGERRQENAAGVVESFYTREVPRVIVNGGARFTLLDQGRFQVTPAIYHRGRSFDSDGDTRLHMTILSTPVEGWTFSLHGENLTNSSMYQPQFVGVNSPQQDVYERDTVMVRAGVAAEF